MRSHGLRNFPDPDVQGGFDDIPSNASPGSPHYNTANRACRSLEGAGKVSAAQQEQAQAQLLKFAQCMRAHGVPDYPDPTANGGVVLVPSLGMSTSSPLFQKAQKACQGGSLKVGS